MVWKQGSFVMQCVSLHKWEFGPSRPGSTSPSTAAEVSLLPDINTRNRGQVRFAIWRFTPKAGRRSAGARDQRVGWNRGSSQCGCNPRMGSWMARLRIKRFGCWCSGRKRKKNPLDIFCATCLLLTHCAVWCESRNPGGKLSRTIFSSKTSWDSITMRGETGPVGTITSAWS